MTLKVEQLNRAELEQLQTVLPDDPSDDQVREIAESLLGYMSHDNAVIRQIETIVRRTVNQQREARTRQEAMEASKHFVFARLARTATKAHPVYDQVRVYARDFEAFCKANNLSEKDMVKVASGVVESHQGWRQGATAGSLGRPRTKVLSADQVPQNAILGPFRAAYKTPASGMNGSVAPVFLTVRTWVPGE